MVVRLVLDLVLDLVLVASYSFRSVLDLVLVVRVHKYNIYNAKKNK